MHRHPLAVLRPCAAIVLDDALASDVVKLVDLTVSVPVSVLVKVAVVSMAVVGVVVLVTVALAHTPQLAPWQDAGWATKHQSPPL